MTSRRTHRRTTSLPIPPEINSGESDGEIESVVDDKRRPSEISNDSESIISESDTMSTYLEVPSLLHSPTLNRRSVSIFNFEDLFSHSCPPSYNSSPPLMESVVVTKIQRIIHSASTSSTESLREDQRIMVLRELLQTEQRYITSLEILLTIFLPALENIMAPRDVRLLFPCQLEPLIEIHQDLLTRLEERIDGISRWHGIVGDVFGRLCSDKEGEFVALYSAYMNEFKIAMQTLARYEYTSPLFCKITSNCSQQPGCEGLSLAAFLLTPVQRLPRYELLLKQLLKHTSEDHPDNYYIEAALNTLHANLILLDHSIQACQFACTVNQLKDDGRSKKSHNRRGSGQRHRRRHQSSRFARIKRHFSQTNIDDFSSPNDSPRLPDRESYTRPNSVLEKSSNLARSESNLLEKASFHDDSNSQSNLSGLSNRAISCSDIRFSNFGNKIKEKSSPQLEEHKDLEEEEEEDDEDVILLTPNMSHSPSIISHDDSTIEVSATLNSRRTSMYSTNSSNSEFDSLVGTTEDYSTHTVSSNCGTLKPLQPLVSTSSTDSGYREGQSDQSTLKSPAKQKKKHPLSNALKVFRRSSLGATLGNSPLTRQKRSTSMGQVNKVDISQPMDFRHIQHGFADRPVSTVL